MKEKESIKNNTAEKANYNEKYKKIINFIINCRIFIFLTKILTAINELNTGVSCKLAHDKVKDLKYYDTDEILEYVTVNYTDSKNFKNINKEKLVEDLISFKTYKVDIEVSSQSVDRITGFLSILATSVSIILAYLLAALEHSTGQDSGFIVRNIIFLILIIILIVLFYSPVVVSIFLRNSKHNKLKVINHAIYILEAIKEDIVEVPETRNFDVNVDYLIDKKSETRDYAIKVTEILDDKSKWFIDLNQFRTF